MVALVRLRRRLLDRLFACRQCLDLRACRQVALVTAKNDVVPQRTNVRL